MQKAVIHFDYCLFNEINLYQRSIASNSPLNRCTCTKHQETMSDKLQKNNQMV
ncbi:hypothetical protein [Clostridium estertheticum]|uniref:hypothetical protein n=1 Tax=Clostridium estertheticum TaxID=238834 RepID=UPI001C6F2289|nr:hypothetical protein [Clostridium estertheticum]MBW9153924.1 hypothetical protein [Clostridium estertheticum]WLC85585.1 hypothetical protein KTC97_07505 [Clostridium estertheticum]